MTTSLLMFSSEDREKERKTEGRDGRKMREAAVRPRTRRRAAAAHAAVGNSSGTTCFRGEKVSGGAEDERLSAGLLMRSEQTSS